VDEHLFDDAPALPADLDRHRAALETRLDRRPPQLLTPLPRNLAVCALELDLARLQDVLDVAPGTLLELELGRRQGQVHGR
jgi:hypothetical protein